MVQRTLVEAAYYLQIETQVKDSKGAGKDYVMPGTKLTIWLRDCNPRCETAEGVIRKEHRFFIQGDTEALVIDADGR